MRWFWESKITRSSRVVLKMGQKVNSISLRLGKRLSWNDSWNVKPGNFGVIQIKTSQKKQYSRFLLKCLGFHINDVIINNSNKSSHCTVKALSKNTSYQIFESTPTQKASNKQKLEKNLRDVFSFSKNRSCVLNLSLFSLKGLSTKKTAGSESLIVLPVFDAQVLADFIGDQVSTSDSLRVRSFSQGLSNGIAKLTMLVLKRSSFSKTGLILGVKVECSGRWKQTGSGRKQRLLFIAGNINAQSIDAVISYGFSTINTKFGTCCFKVWVCFRHFPV